MSIFPSMQKIIEHNGRISSFTRGCSHPKHPSPQEGIFFQLARVKLGFFNKKSQNTPSKIFFQNTPLKNFWLRTLLRPCRGIQYFLKVVL